MKKYYDYISEKLNISIKYVEYNESEYFYNEIDKNTKIFLYEPSDTCLLNKIKKLFKNITLFDNKNHLVNKKEYEYITKIIKPNNNY